mgnify:CR=1 FL=1|jgi:hypothetical protein
MRSQDHVVLKTEMTIELRSFELKVHATGQRLEGYAALFDIETRIGHLVESIAPGAFGVSLSRDVIALVGHDHSRVLARTCDKTLRLSEDSKGLAFDFDVPATSAGNNVFALVERGDLSGTSFGFVFHEGGETWDGNKRTLRTIDLREISLVSAWPASKARGISVGAKVVKMVDFLTSRFTLAAPGISCVRECLS